MKSKTFKWVSVAVSGALLLGGCGGGSSDSGSSSDSGGSTSNTTSLKGVVAVGAPLAGATITIVDSKGTIKTDIIAAADGTYAFPAGMTGPVVIKAALGSEVLYSAYSIAPGQSSVYIDACPPGSEQAGCKVGDSIAIPEAERPAQININVLTDVMVRNAMADNLASYFAGTTKPTYANTSKMPEAVQNLAEQLIAITEATGLLTATEFQQADPFTSVMKADKTNKLDVLMEAFNVSCVNADGSAVTAPACPNYSVEPKFPLPIGFDTAKRNVRFDPTNANGAPDSNTTTAYGDSTVKAKMTAFIAALQEMDMAWVNEGCESTDGTNFICTVRESVSSTTTKRKQYNGTTWVDVNA